jgi:hypothetical protein
MVLNIVPVDRSLWRIAELSSHCSDPSWPGDKDQAWSALKEAIADLRALVMETTAAIEAAELRAARAEGRIRVVRRERDRERAAHQAARAAADAARDTARAAQDRAKASQDRADKAQAALAAAFGAREAAKAAGEELERTAVLNTNSDPGRTEDTPDPGPDELQPAQEPGSVPRGVMDISAKAETVLRPVERYLHVGATMGNLLPENLGELLVEGATLVRREGRLAALISVPSEESEWAAPGPRAEEQVQHLTAEGFRVQWVREICLAS